jgi:hypothetical protein
MLPAAGQSTGRLSGIVRDQTGAVVADAIVSLFRPGMTEPAVQTTTTRSGLFEFDALPPESYRVVVEKTGFAAYQANNVQLSPGTETPLNGIQLELGQQPTVVNANERVQSVQNSNAEISTTLTTEQLERLPILNRNPLDLVKTQAGVVRGGGTGPDPFTTINGLRTSFSNVTLEGVNIQDNTIRSNGLDFLQNDLRIGQVSQFTLVTSNQSAIYGNGATQTAFVLPSGNNELHGSLFYENSNNVFNANSWFQNASGLHNAIKNNQGGFTVGGPLIRNKLFGYAAYEFLRSRNSIGLQTTTLSAADRAIVTAARNGVSNVNSTVASLLDQIPLPNVSDSSRYQHAEKSVSDLDNATARLDFVPTQRSTFVISYLWNRVNVDSGLSRYGNHASDVQREKATLLSFAWRHTFSARLTNELRAGADIAPVAFINLERTTPYFLNLGPVLQTFNPVSTGANAGRKLKTYDFQDNASYVFGRHNLQFGFQAQLIRLSIYAENGSVPTVFLGTGTNVFNNSNEAAVLSGSYFGLGTQRFFPVNRAGALGAAPALNSPSIDNYAPYIQDTWRVNRKLALTLGLRYDLYTRLNDDRGLSYVPRLVNGNVLNTFTASSTTFELRENQPYNTDKNNFAPSFGMAFDPLGNGRTVFRAAYGISYVNDDFVSALGGTIGVNAFNIGVVASTVLFGNLSNLGSLTPPSGGTTVTAPGSSAIGLIDPNFRIPYVQQWSGGVQHEAAGFLLDLRYIGNHGTKLLRLDDQSGSGRFIRYAANRSGSTYNALQFDISRRLRSAIQFQANYTWSKTLTDSDVISSAFSDSYRDPTKFSLDRGPARFDLRHAFKTNLIYDLPLARARFGSTAFRHVLGGWSISAIAFAQSGQPFSIRTGNGNQTAATLIGGSALNRIVSLHLTGYGPSIIASSAINPANGSGVGFANQVFFVPPPGSPGFLGPRSFYGPGSFDLDLGIQKRFRITERQSFELRGVAVNVLNHPSFGFGDQSISSAAFGGSSAAGRANVFTVFPARTIQLSAYYRF